MTFLLNEKVLSETMDEKNLIPADDEGNPWDKDGNDISVFDDQSLVPG